MDHNGVFPVYAVSNLQVKVLILTVHNEMDYLMQAVDIGVDGYILKDSESSEFGRKKQKKKQTKKSGPRHLISAGRQKSMERTFP